MKPRSNQPTISVVRSASKGSWLANVQWPDRKKRVRTILHVPLDQDPAKRFEEWKREVLPSILAEHEAEIATTTTPDTDNPTLAEVFNWFLETHLVHAKVTQKTIDHYARTLLSFRTFCASRHATRVQQVSWRLIQDWQIFTDKHRPMTATTAPRTELSNLRYVFEQALDARVMTVPLDVKFKLPPKAKKSRYAALDMETTLAFYAALKVHAAAIFDPTWWIYLTGWLPSDFLDFRICEVNFSRNVFDHVRFKTGYEMKDYPITPEMREVIDRNLRGRPLDSAEPIFLTPKGKRWDYFAYKKRLEYFCKQHFDRNVCPRDLRKTFATHLAKAGENPKALKELMGHSDIETTFNYYVDVDTEELRETGIRHVQRFRRFEPQKRDH